MRSACLLLPVVVVMSAFAAGSGASEAPSNSEASPEIAVGVLSAARAESSPQSDYDEVKRVIEYGIGWAVEKDFDKMFSIWAHDERLYHHWLTSSSTTHGFAEFEAHAESWKDPKFKGTTSEFRDLEITFSKSGDVAWYSCRLDDCYEFDGTPGCVENVLQTGVLEKRDGKWVHVLMHGSYPVDEIPIEYVRRYYGDAAARPDGDAEGKD